MSLYLSRTRRNCSIAVAKDGFEGSARFFVDEVWIAGRIVGILDDGFVLQDETGRIDVCFGETVNVGDIVEVKILEERVMGGQGGHGKGGEEGKGGEGGEQSKGGEGGEQSKGGEGGEQILLYRAAALVALAPCVTEFFVKKDDPNYRRMVIDRNLRETLNAKMKLVAKIREFFVMRGFCEVETPELVRLPGMEPHLDPFLTRFFEECKNGVCKRPETMYLITSPEYAMKKLLVSGYEKIFQVCKSFRNKEAFSELHNPEFTLLEWYRAYASYEEIMKDTEELVDFLARDFYGGSSIKFKEYTIDTTPPWPRIKVKDIFKEYAVVGLEDFEDVARFRAVVAKKGYKVDATTTFDDMFFLVFMNEIEPKLGLQKPIIIYEYPASMAALSKKCVDDPRYAERFEVYMGGVELCNAFTELNDPVEQEARLQEERMERQRLGRQDYSVDQSFIRALEFAMPPAGGNALGVDRLAMLLLDKADIRDVLFFPFGDLLR